MLRANSVAIGWYGILYLPYYTTKRLICQQTKNKGRLKNRDVLY